MHDDQHIDRVRRRIRSYLEQLGGAPNAPLLETILMRDGFYCGRRFQANDAYAVWFFEEDQIKLHSAEGELLQVWDVVPAAEPEGRKTAA